MSAEQVEDDNLGEPEEQDQDQEEEQGTSSASAAGAADAQNKVVNDEATQVLETLGHRTDSANVALMQQMLAALQTQTMRKSGEGEKKENHKFWSTQPVMDYDDNDDRNEPIEPDKKPEEIRQTPYPLPSGFEWSEIDINNEAELKELYDLLSLNYVEDDDAMFRFDYSADFLRWALQPPGWLKSWHPGVRVTSTKKLVAFISAIPAEIRIYDHHQKMVEINFLCVHKKLRTKRLAPVLIKEITRRVHQQNIFQAAYTAGIRLPRPVTSCRYFHRNLNPKKLIETGFSHLSRNLSLAGTIKLYKLPENPLVPGLRPMEAKDVPAVANLLSIQLSLYSFAPMFTEEEVKHYFVPREGVVYSYVVETDNIVTDFVSFYSLPSSVINHPLHKRLDAAYLYYYAVSKTALKDLVKDALILAKKKNFDVFNCLNLMDNQVFLEDLKFGIGDGTLQFYLYNWSCKRLEHNKCGIVLL